MLETGERRVADLDMQLRTPSKRTAPVALASVVQTHLGDLRATLGTDVDSKNAPATLAAPQGRSVREHSDAGPGRVGQGHRPAGQHLPEVRPVDRVRE